ncbi:MAG TPA: tetratricopeptide repeat protein [Kofleriaceae bacterium]|nr:tetratricopeptide repeat protein [Kofleriaceae bacterium]
MIHRALCTAAACAVLLASAPAAAQPTGDKQKALELYDKGNVQYNLGRWDEAVELFTKAYEAYSAPEFLFNIAQAHRQAGRCTQALFFYRRYLAVKPDAPNRGEVEGFIGELEPTCEGAGGDGAGGPGGPGGTGGTGDETAAGGAGASGPRVAEPTGTVEGGAGAGGEEDGGDGDLEIEDGIEPAGQRARLLSASVAVGPAFLAAGELTTPVLAGFALGAGYPLQVGAVRLEPGAAVTYSMVRWTGGAMDEIRGTSGLVGLLANLGVSYPLAPRLVARADAALGVLIMGGLYRGNPFLNEDEFADDPIGMFHARVAIGAAYQVTDRVGVQLQPALALSPSGPLRDDISTLTRFEVLVGARFEM